jgi:hypothetical protein
MARSRRTPAMLPGRCSWELSGRELQRKIKSHNFLRRYTFPPPATWSVSKSRPPKQRLVAAACPGREIIPSTRPALGTPSPHSSSIVRSPRPEPYHNGRRQVYPEPQVEALMSMNKDQYQHPGKKSPQHRRPRLRNKKPPHVDPSNK